MAKATQLLSVLARINPAIFDYIFPHGPAVAHAFASRFSEVALNPQPLPPARKAAESVSAGRAQHRIRRDRRRSRRAG